MVRMMEKSNPLKIFSPQKELAGAATLDLNGLVRKAVSLLEYQMRARNIAVSVCLHKDPLFVKGDFHLLSQALLHMLLGIIKSFETYEGEKQLMVSTVKHEGKAVLNLSDSILDSSDELFDIFKSHDIPGKMRGLGTPLAHRIIKIHGGAMAFKLSSKGRSFRIEIPLLKTCSPRKGNGSLRILVVDDDAIVVDVFREFLELLGHEATVLRSPLKALDLLVKEKFDFVLVDLRMPEMNGITFMQKAEEFIDKNRLWLLTGDILSFEVELLKKRGNIRILEKPVSIERFKTLFDNSPGDDR
ncbi:sensory/regulatory protein RpfC [bacterium BMS3Bbin07]|nr:sensory/regulatory protein RpfC [bacterium BMS3Bbin07]